MTRKVRFEHYHTFFRLIMSGRTDAITWRKSLSSGRLLLSSAMVPSGICEVLGNEDGVEAIDMGYSEIAKVMMNVKLCMNIHFKEGDTGK